MKPFRFHVIGMPTTASNHEYLSCAFTQGIIHFCKMMKKLGHYVVHYGHELSQVECDEQVNILTNKHLIESYGEEYITQQTWKIHGFSYKPDEHRSNFYKRLLQVICSELKHGDFVCTFDGGNAFAFLDTLHGVINYRDDKMHVFFVEPQIGYVGPIMNHRLPLYHVFTSNALRVYCNTNHKHVINIQNTKNHYYTQGKQGKPLVSGIPDHLWMCAEYEDTLRQTVIPYCIDEDEFLGAETMSDLNHNYSNYLLFLARISYSKGLDNIILATEIANKKLVVAGPGQWDLPSVGGTSTSIQRLYSIRKHFYSKGEAKMLDQMDKHLSKSGELPAFCNDTSIPLLPIPDHVTFVGFADIHLRKHLISRSDGLIVYPTYEEPFGKISIEAMFMGKPLITGPRGGYNEVITHKETGFLCRSFKELVEGIQQIQTIDTERCKQEAQKYTLQNIAPLYQEYFTRIYRCDIEQPDQSWYSL